MDTFNFPYHKVRTIYPDNSARVQFGGAYEFVAKPNAPDQRIFILTFAAMRFFFTSGTLDANVSPTVNYKNFRNFYEAHRLYEKFTYPHPEFGNLTVRFHKPLNDPEGIAGGNGAVGQFEIELIEQP